MAEDISNSPAPSSPKQGSGKAGLIIVIILIVIAILGVAGWAVSRYVGRKLGENVAEGLIGAATGGKVNVDSNGESVSIKTDEGSLNVGTKTWPKDMPSVVPKFTYGSISGSLSVTDPASWSVTFENADSDAYAKYQKDLQRAGFVTKEQSEVESIKTMEMAHTDWQILFSVDSTSKAGSLEVTAVAK
jgi:flagellar basal body-associated protein FliL